MIFFKVMGAFFCVLIRKNKDLGVKFSCVYGKIYTFGQNVMLLLLTFKRCCCEK